MTRLWMFWLVLAWSVAMLLMTGITCVASWYTIELYWSLHRLFGG